MTKAEAIAMLKRIQEPEAWEPQINQAAFEALDMAIEALDCSESPNSSDTISRQAAIDAICRDGVRLERGGALMITISTAKQWAVDLLCDLPSAQPEPCDDPRADVYYLAEKIGIHRLYALVVELRGEPDPCEDAVSRADVEIEIVNLLKGVFVEYEDIAKKVAARLPSVTPKRKTGKWIDAVIPNDNGGLPVQVCDQCNTFFPLAYTGGGHRFCPNCGEDMRKEKNNGIR